MNPQDDGVTHINVYSKGRTELGRFLSNFWHDPKGRLLETEDGFFKTLEGYWYWLGCHDERLRNTLGFESKKLGRELGAKDWLDEREFQRKILYATALKVYAFPQMAEELKKSTLPLVHYYVTGNVGFEVTKASWIMAFLDVLRDQLKVEEAECVES